MKKITVVIAGTLLPCSVFAATFYDSPIAIPEVTNSLLLELRAAHLNTDTRQDLVALGITGGQPELTLLSNTQGLTLQPMQRVSVPSLNRDTRLIIADVNGDQADDLFLFSPSLQQPPQLILAGKQTAQKVAIDAELPVFAAATDDVDQDGDRDFLIYHALGYDQHRISILFNEGNGFLYTERQTEIPKLSATVTSMALADLNTDGYPDLILGTGANSANNIVIYNESGAFKANRRSLAKPPHPTQSYPVTKTITAIDFENDQRPDLVFGYQSEVGDFLSTVANTTSQQLIETTTRSLGQNLSQMPSASIRGLTALDFNQDGFTDFALNLTPPDNVTSPPHIWLNDGQGNFSALPNSVLSLETAQPVMLAALSTDQGHDLAVQTDQTYYLPAKKVYGTGPDGLDPTIFGVASFNEAYYLQRNPDVRHAVDQGHIASGFAHYLNSGTFEGRVGSAAQLPVYDATSQQITFPAIFNPSSRKWFHIEVQFKPEESPQFALKDSHSYLQYNVLPASVSSQEVIVSSPPFALGNTNYVANFAISSDDTVRLLDVTPNRSYDIPFGDLTALIQQGLLPNYQSGTRDAVVDHDINWGGAGGERGEIGLFPEDHAAYIAGMPVSISEILAVADQPATENLSYGHFPNLYWLPYLMTGDSRYVERMEALYKTIADKINRPYDNLLYYGLDGRYLAWPLRLLGQLAYLEARGLTQAQYYSTSLQSIREHFLNHAMSGKPEYQANDTWRVLNFNSVTHESYGWTSWMESMVGQTLNTLVLMGFEEWRPVAEWQFEHLKKRTTYWPLKAVDGDHVFFFQHANGAITDWASAKVWANSHGWNDIHAYTDSRQFSPTYANWPDNKLFIADTSVDGRPSPHTYRNRAQYAYGWAALAAANNLTDAQALADLLWDKINERGDAWDFKNRISRLQEIPNHAPLDPNALISDVPNVSSDAIWAPQRDANGIVTASSWQSLEVATPNNPVIYKIDGLDPVQQIRDALTARGFDYRAKDFGTADVQGTFTAWTGMAFDHSTKKGWLPWGGGHADASLNGVWEFDIARLRWEIEAMPSDPDEAGAIWSDNYRNSGSFSVYQDQHGNKHPTLPDGHPPSMHTYGGVAKVGDTLISTRNYRYSYNLRTKQFGYDVWQYDGQDYFPSINNYLFAYQGKGYGILQKQYQYTGWHRLPSAESNVIEDAPRPFGLTWVGEHSIAQIDDHRLVAISNDKLSIFDMASERWSPMLMLKDMPQHNYTQELQATLYVPWGDEGAVLRQFTYGNLKGKWVLIDLVDGHVSDFRMGGYPIKACSFPGTKAFTMEIGGISAFIYTCVDRSTSETYVMRIR